MYPVFQCRILAVSLDDDPQVSDLTNRSVTGDAFPTSGFVARYWAVLFIFFSAPRRTLSNVGRHNVEKWKASSGSGGHAASSTHHAYSIYSVEADTEAKTVGSEKTTRMCGSKDRRNRRACL
jgi:hypothetical protein